jgi:lipopolysaccharide/colanic/teichoic acid biosynthesis glycosyltransferase
MLRRLHLDELPQLALVLTGKMSLVGPRPEMPNLYDSFDPGFAEQRTAVRPGCTGLWQISEKCDRMIFEHPEFDAFYLANRSLRLDLWVIVRSIRMLLPSGRPRLITHDELSRWTAGDTPAVNLRTAVTTVEA